MRTIKQERIINAIRALVLIMLLLSQACYGDDFRSNLNVVNNALVFYGDGIGELDTVRSEIRVLLMSNTESVRNLGFILDEIVVAQPSQELSWDISRRLSKAIRSVLAGVKITEASPKLVLEFISSQYLIKSYLGLFEIAPEDIEMIISMSDLELLKVYDDYYSSSLSMKAYSSWLFVRKAILLSYQTSNNPGSAYRTPIVVYRGVRTLTR